jgi:3'(2'), 5'-bisphosphate nucleotidase
MDIHTIHLIDIVAVAQKAGSEILKVYDSRFDFEYKEDQSPLTIADKKSHEIITESLERLYPHIPVLSEEGKGIAYDQRKEWEYFWLVDPLDGTKEFISRNGEFTVNIALIYRNTPVLGVVYAPVLDTVYYAKEGYGAFKVTESSRTISSSMNDEQLLTLSASLPGNETLPCYTVVASRSHMSEKTKEYIHQLENKYKNIQLVSVGSSLKLCMVAEGKVNEYPRFGPTMEWDTAAGQAIIEQASGMVMQYKESSALLYNKEELVNPWFIAKRKK